MRMWDAWASIRNGKPGTSTSYVPSLIQLANDPHKPTILAFMFLFGSKEKGWVRIPTEFTSSHNLWFDTVHSSPWQPFT